MKRPQIDVKDIQARLEQLLKQAQEKIAQLRQMDAKQRSEERRVGKEC